MCNLNGHILLISFPNMTSFICISVCLWVVCLYPWDTSNAQVFQFFMLSTQVCFIILSLYFLHDIIKLACIVWYILRSTSLLFYLNIFKGLLLFSTSLNYCFHIAICDFKDYERKNMPLKKNKQKKTCQLKKLLIRRCSLKLIGFKFVFPFQRALW